MIDDSELLAGIAFLRRYAHPDYAQALVMAEAAVKQVREERRRNVLRATPASELELSVRSANALSALGLKTVGDVESFVSFRDEPVLERGKRHGFGKKCLKEVRGLLKSLGLEVRGGT